ncbi:MAG: N-acetyltransferase [Planctomycetota bacterium]
MAHAEPGGAAPEVREVAGWRERHAFLRLPWSIYEGDPHWVPPLLRSVDHQLDADRHPFFEHAEARLYLAWRGGRPAGRIAAIVNHRHNSYHKDRRGFWGFFESEDDAATALALLDAAAEDLRRHGMTEMQGPFNPSVNAECGLLIDGFDRRPALLMPYNPPYYPALVERAGLTKAQDLYAYDARAEEFLQKADASGRLARLARAVERRRPEISVRPLDTSNYAAEVTALGRVFNTARRDNWAYVPATDAEMAQMAREMKPIIDPRLVLVAEVRGDLAGCILALPDVNPILQRMNGRVLPFGWLRLLLGRRRVRRMRVFGAACLPRYQNLGVTALLFHRFTRGVIEAGYDSAEISWVAEGNVKSADTILSAISPTLYKRYRVYTRDL